MTIRMMIVDNAVMSEARKHLKNICAVLPNDTPEGREFAAVMNKFHDGNQRAESAAEVVVDRAIAHLVEKVMDERDDLSDYPHLRSKLVEAIGKGR